ncbi:cytochrome c family protein [Parasphingopyxis sp. CP4]|nr:cytochrome c family protein [Parasphingopyxis sp. CP4]QLC22464.1 cytochrome c family protein [Parasphingopyxis sp. CP4]
MRKMHRILAPLAAAGLIVTAGCSGGGDEGPPSSDGDSEETATVEEAEETPAADSTDTMDGTVFAEFTGDAAAGETVFSQCRACHVVDPGVNRTGPTLHNIVGAEAGQIDGFNYTDANANSGIVWTPEKLFQYLERPQRIIPGTRMAFAGLSDPQDRADLIAYLEANSE